MPDITIEAHGAGEMDSPLQGNDNTAGSRVSQTVAGSITAEQVEVSLSAVGAVDVDMLDTGQTFVGLSSSLDANLEDSAVGVLFADVAIAERSTVGVAVTRELRGSNNRSLVLLAGKVYGTVHTALDTRGSLLAGLVGGAVIGFILWLGNLVTRKD